MEHCKFSTLTCKAILVGRQIWEKYKDCLHCIKNILMPAYKMDINESGTNKEDALNKTRWAHWVFKTNAATKAKKKSSTDDTDNYLYRNVSADDCPSKETYTFPEYETFVAFRSHALLSREVRDFLSIPC